MTNMIRKLLLRACATLVLIRLVESVVCSSNKLCRSELLTSSVKTKTSYLSTKQMSSTLLNAVALDKSTVESEQHCLKKCAASTQCLSINLITNLTANESKMECQLLSQQAYADKDKLVYQENSTHYTALNAGCEKGLCTNNSTCLPNYVDDTNTCKCVSASFDGTLCEKELKVVLLRYSRIYNYGNDIEAMVKETNFRTSKASSSCLFQFNDVNSVASNLGGQAFAYFVAPETAFYSFKMSCNYFCRLYISTPGKHDRRIILLGQGTASAIYLEEGTERFFEMLISQPQNANNNAYSSTFSLGITFPNGTTFDPIENRYLASKSRFF